MMRLAILDSDGKVVLPNDVATAAELVMVVEQARILIRECEQLTQKHRSKGPSSGGGQIPYLS